MQPIVTRKTPAAADAREQRDVRMMGLPVALFLRTQEHHDELVREFTLMAIRESATDVGSTPRTVLPARLRELIDILGRRFDASTSRADIELQAAVERGDPTVDLTYHVRSHVAAELIVSTELMDDADEFCRQEKLLTLPRDAAMVAFSRWYNREFLRQLDGLPPTPWDGPVS
ncbi:MAG TPA: hypothetical protein VGD55_11515 [Acidothermaceae bacterium]